MKYRATALAGCLLLALAACETLNGTGPMLDPILRANLLSPEEERQLGAQVAAEVEAREPILDDPALQAYVDRVGQRLAAVVERRDVEYRFRVIDAPDTINAFALPGGYMYLYTGLLLLMENEAEMAGVMGHEIAHVSSGHHGQAMTRAYGLQFLRQTLGAGDRGRVGQLADGFLGAGGGVAQLAFSREAERESDMKGMNYMVRAGYHPSGMVTFMEKMLAADQRAGAGQTPTLLRSHPATDARIAAMNTQMLQFPAETREAGQLHAERYRQEVLERLR